MKKTAKIILGVFAIVFALWGVVAYFAPGQCTLCNFIKSHAPCIVNMQTGEVQELDLYFPHTTLVGEIADVQESSIFSFVSAAGATGTKTTSPYIIQLDVPMIQDPIIKHKFCTDCRKKLGNQSFGYVLADLYIAGEPVIIPIEDGMQVNLRCYEITAVRNSADGVYELTIKGTYDN